MSKKRRKKKPIRKKTGFKFGWWQTLAFGTIALLVAWWWWNNRFPVKGIDVSRYQGQIEWEKVKAAGTSFAFIKATEGEQLVDPTFVRNWQASKAAGIVRSPYHFYRPAIDPKIQARHFLAQIKMEPGDLPPVLDLEVTDGRSASRIREGVITWMEVVEKALGIRPILYTTPKFAEDYLDGQLNAYPMWLVDLGWGSPDLPPGVEQWAFWQYSHHGRVDGIGEEVDLNYFHGSREALENLCKKR